MESQVIFCNVCGAENKAVSNFCLDCGEALVALHPVESEGGMVLTLVCWGCGGLITVYKDEGFLACEQCGLVHRVVSGPGYLTIQPAPGETVPPEDEIPEDQFNTEEESQPAAVEVVNPEKPAVPLAAVDVPSNPSLSKQEALIQRQKHLLTEINIGEALIAEAKTIRKQGWILFGVAVVDLLLLWNFTGGYIVAPGYILMLAAGLLFLVAGIARLVIGNNKRNQAGPVDELEAKKTEQKDLERQLAELDVESAQDRPAELPGDGLYPQS